MDTAVGPALFDGQRLEQERKAQGFTTSSLAALVGYRRDAYRLWERGLNVPPANALSGLAFHLRLDINDLFRPLTPDDLASENGAAEIRQVVVVKSVPRHRRQGRST